MTRPRLLLIAALCAAVTVAGALVSAFGPERVTLTGADLSERINRTLPRQFRNVTVDHATVTVAGGRVAVRVEVRVTGLGRTVATAVAARGVPHYDAGRGEVLFAADEVKLEDSGSGSLMSQLGIRVGVGSRLGDAADDVVAAAVRAWLATRPVYRFKDDIRGVVLKAAIEDVAVDGDRLVISASLVRLTAAVGAWLGGLLAVVLIAAWFALPDLVALAVSLLPGRSRKRPKEGAPPG